MAALRPPFRLPSSLNPTEGASPQSITVTKVTETESAKTVTPVNQNQFIGVTATAETETAQTVAPYQPDQSITVTKVSETETVQTITPRSAPWVHSVSAAQAGSSDFTLVEPTGTAEDDILLCHIEYDPSTYTSPGYDAPTGWTLLYNDDTNQNGDSHHWLAAIRRGASAPNLSLNRSGGSGSINHAIVKVAAVRGAESTETITDVVKAQGTDSTFWEAPNTTIDFPSVTTDGINTLILFLAVFGGRGWDVSSPTNSNLSDFTAEWDDETNWGTDGTVWAHSGVMASAGTTGTTSFGTLSSNAQNYDSQGRTVAVHSFLPQKVTVTKVTETETGKTVTPVLADQYITVTKVTEAESAGTVTTGITVSVSAAAESESAQTVTPVLGVAVVAAAETEAAVAVAVQADQSITVTATSETETAQTVTPTVLVSVGKASETETAQAIVVTFIVTANIAFDISLTVTIEHDEPVIIGVGVVGDPGWTPGGGAARSGAGIGYGRRIYRPEKRVVRAR